MMEHERAELGEIRAAAKGIANQLPQLTAAIKEHGESNAQLSRGMYWLAWAIAIATVAQAVAAVVALMK